MTVARTIRRWRAFWLSVPPVRALSEVLGAQALLLIWAFIAIAQVRIFTRSMTLIAALAVLSGPCCILWCNFRMRPLAGAWRWRVLRYTSIGVGVAVAPSLILAGAIYSIRSKVMGIPSLAFFAIWIVAFTVAFLISHLGVWLLTIWDRLQRTHFQWSLTHAHLMVVVLGAVLLSALIVGSNVYFEATSQSHNGTPLTLLPILFVLFIVTVIVLLVVLPPSAIFSYLFARRTTRRLQSLMQGTSALRDGDYSVRVAVKGEDEVAQLQANFNAMAADLEQAVSELQAERDTVARLLEARRQLIASVSHELRTPVATLRGYLESTRIHWDGTPPPTLRHDLEVMERETIHLQKLINDLFTLARAEVNKLDLRRAPTDVGQLAQRIVEMMAPLAWQGSRVEMAAAVAPDLPPALVDASRLEEALQNLLHNAVRHTPPGGIVAVAASAEAETIVLQVKDTGEGIAPEDLPRIWERFYRSERSRANPNSGTGLGLALVKELSEAMGGSVAVESVLGEGSCFTIRVPSATNTSGTRKTPALQAQVGNTEEAALLGA